MSKKIIININTAWNLFNFRASLIRKLISSGYEVIALAPKDRYVEQLESLGCRFIDLEMDNKGKNPLQDLKLIWSYVRILKTEKPDLCLFYTVKDLNKVLIFLPFGMKI